MACAYNSTISRNKLFLGLFWHLVGNLGTVSRGMASSEAYVLAQMAILNLIVYTFRPQK